MCFGDKVHLKLYSFGWGWKREKDHVSVVSLKILLYILSSFDIYSTQVGNSLHFWPFGQLSLRPWNFLMCQIESNTQSESESLVAQSCPTLWDPMDYSLPGSSVHGIFPARVLEWVVISFSRGSSWPSNLTQVSHIVGRRFTVWAKLFLNFYFNYSFLWTLISIPQDLRTWIMNVRNYLNFPDFWVVWMEFGTSCATPKSLISCTNWFLCFLNSITLVYNLAFIGYS